MDSGPLPPHERTWRHPSELGPTKYDVDAGPTSRIATLAAGTLAVFAVAAIVVAMTPRPSSSPLVSATTTPRSTSAVVATPAGNPAYTALQSPAARRSSSTALFTTFASYPHSILATPQANLESVGVATEEPDDDDIVSLRTEAVTYRLAWELVALVDVPDGSVVFDGNGDVVARIYGGDVLSVVGD